MGQFYDKIWDEERVFLFIYFKEYFYEHERDENNPNIVLAPKVSKIREKIKDFDKYGITDIQFKQKLIDLQYCNDTDATEDRIVIQDGIMQDILEKIDEIYSIFLSKEFLEFLYRQQMFSEKRIIIDYINKIKIKTGNISTNNIRKEFIEFLVKNFNTLTKLFLQHKAKFIF